jgi:hypothetical protein
MARGSYNTTYDAYYGTGGSWGPPGVKFITAQPCRLVYYDRVLPQYGFAYYETAWLTEDSGLLLGPTVTVPGVNQALFYTADAALVSVPSGALPTWWVSSMDYVVPFVLPPYYRWHLAPLPLPF